ETAAPAESEISKAVCSQASLLALTLAQKGRGNSFRRSFGNGLHLRQTFLEIRADHFVHVHEHHYRLGDEILLAHHCPLHIRLIALWREGEVGGVRRSPRFDELELDLNEIAWVTLGDRHAAFADLIVADPAIDRSVAGCGA